MDEVDKMHSKEELFHHQLNFVSDGQAWNT